MDAHLQLIPHNARAGYDYPCKADPVTGAPAPPDTDICCLKPAHSGQPHTCKSHTTHAGYDYPCEADPVTGAPAAPDTDICRLKPVPFQGAACSDAAGVQRCYSEIMQSE